MAEAIRTTVLCRCVNTNVVYKLIILEMKITRQYPGILPGKKKEKKKSGFLQLAVSSDWRKPAVNGYRPKKKKKKKRKRKKKKNVLIGYFAYYIPL